MARVDVFLRIVCYIFMVGDGLFCVMRVEIEEVAALAANEIVGRRRTAARKGTLACSCFYINSTTYPAIPTDWGIWRVAIKGSQYIGVILSMPRRVRIRIKVGRKSWPSGFATLLKLSS